jgi:hypothetical protein
MKDVCKVLGMIAFVAIVGFSTSSCIINLDDDGGDKSQFSGTWKGVGNASGLTLVFTSSNWSMTFQGITATGTYIVSGNTATLTDSSGDNATAVLSGSNLIFTYEGNAYTLNRDGGGGQTSNPFSGTWYGTGDDYGSTLVFTSSRWTLTTSGEDYSGTYTRNGNTATGKDDDYGENITATISGNNLTFNWGSVPYYFRR